MYRVGLLFLLGLGLMVFGAIVGIPYEATAQPTVQVVSQQAP